MMRKNDTLYLSIQKLLNSQRFGVLSTHSEDSPYCSLVGFATDEGCRHLYFATTRQSRKFRNILMNPKVAMLVDSRTNRMGDINEACACSALGDAIVMDDTGKKSLTDLYVSKLPDLGDFLKLDDCAMVSITVRRYIMVSHFQTVSEYAMLD